jgi:hypothetical protein
MVRRPAKPIQSLLKKPKLVDCISWIARRWLNHGKFIVWKFCVAKCVLTISLLQHTFGTYCLGKEKAERRVFEDGSVALGLVINVVFKVSEYHNSRFGSDRIAIFVMFHNKNTHRR